jgi:hypothetical protein
VTIKYVVRDEGIIRVSDGSFIPTDANNPSYQQYTVDVADDPDCVQYIVSTMNLATYQSSAKAEIDNFAESIRKKYITAGSGQSMTYQQKAEEAAAYKSAGYPVSTAGYPHVQAEADALLLTPTAAADAILATRDAWLIISAAIEKERMRGKRRIGEATSIDQVSAFLSDAKTALEAL